MSLLTWISKRRFPYEPLIRIEISKDKLIHNLSEFRKLAPKNHDGHPQIAPVLKSNAYGHGLIEVAKILQHEPGIPFLIVDSYFEAVALRSKGINHHILIIGYTRPETILTSNLHNISFTITSADALKSIINQKKSVRIHLKIDTGMRRQGILPTETNTVIDLLMNQTSSKYSVILEGITSHFSDADNADGSFSESQIHIWNEIVKHFKHEFKSLKYIHLSATDGHRFTHDINANVSRIGIGFYGLSQNSSINSRLNLLPALEMKTIITGIKSLTEGETVGYGNTFRASKDMHIATIPVGYFEGLDRRLSNIGTVLVGPNRIPCKIIGRISMNIASIDVSDVFNANEVVKIGDEVVVISKITNDQNSIVNMAKKCETISYEIAVHIPAHLKRIVI